MGGILTDGMRELRSYSSGEVYRREEKGIDRRKHDRHHEGPREPQLWLYFLLWLKNKASNLFTRKSVLHTKS